MAKRVLTIVFIVLIAAAVIVAALYYYHTRNSGIAADKNVAIQTAQNLPSPAFAAQPAEETAKAEALGYPEEWNDEGIFADYYKQAYNRLIGMSLEEKVGQMFLAYGGGEAIRENIKTLHLGGLVLFAQDFEGKTANEVLADMNAYQAAANIPLILAADEEGGTVVRISSNSELSAEAFGSPKEVYETGGLAAVKSDASKKAKLMKSLGLNLNLAPVADVSVDPGDYMYPRTLGMPAEETAAYVAAVVQASKEGGISSALKHFPGYGSNSNTHTGLAVDKRSLREFAESDFLPFKSGIEAGSECVLVSHTIVLCMDDKMPASLSAAVHTLLRDELGFTGVILTDDLSMDAIAEAVGEAETAVDAVLAGNDMLITPDYKDSIAAVLAAVDIGKLDTGTIDRAVFRILAWKYACGIMED